MSKEEGKHSNALEIYLKTINAALFRVFGSLCNRYLGIPARIELQYSILDRTEAQMRFGLRQQKDNGKWY